MESTEQSTSQTDHWTAAWGSDYSLAGCETCDTTYLVPYQKVPMACPHCGVGELLLFDETADGPVYTHPPEQIVPFSVQPGKVRQTLKDFTSSIWIKPHDLKPEKLNGRLQQIFLPLWLVDADVQAKWQAEVGFNYDIVSHREKYSNNQWQTQRIQETKIRWEPRVGTLTRHYDNKIAPAMEEHNEFANKLGRYRLEDAQPYDETAVDDAVMRLPNRAPDDAWSTAQIALRTAAIEECRQATAADHIREFKWQAAYRDQHWTQMLLPLYTTYYMDDDDKAQMIFVHGQTGKLFGSKRASMKKARKYALVFFVIASIIAGFSFLLLLGGLFLATELMGLASLGFMAAVFIGFLAMIPLVIAWYTNHVSYVDTARQLAKDVATLSGHSASS